MIEAILALSGCCLALLMLCGFLEAFDSQLADRVQVAAAYLGMALLAIAIVALVMHLGCSS